MLKKLYTRGIFTTLCGIAVVLASCTGKNLGSSEYYTEDPFEDYVDYTNEDVLKDPRGWEITPLGTGFNWYNYEGFYQDQNANQIVNVLEIDLNNPEYTIEFAVIQPNDSLSSVGLKRDAIAGINGTYEFDASFVKSAGTVFSYMTLPKDHLRFWKHEGAIFYDGKNQASISYGTKDDYVSSTSPNIYSGAPMLIDDFKTVGEDFTGNLTGIDLSSLDGEDYRRHQGSRHPRTAVAVTGGGKLLMITVDGRRNESAGMTAKELTQFINRYFEPRSALNIDGGGSTTMWIKDTESPNGVVNYPTDNSKYDHFGQRRVSTFILVKEVSTDAEFAGGQGTQFDPYIIKTARHMGNMKNVDWSNATKSPVYFRLEADIDMAGIMWEPINYSGDYERHLHFDGNGHVIKNLTCTGYTYSSLFGVLCGSCKNLGVIDAYIDTSGGGGGIICGYVGLKGPDKPTGLVENCYTSGTVIAVDAAGGIAGNVGKPNANGPSVIRNCYSTATVMTTSTGNSRPGGIAGIVFEKGVVENCYSTGVIISENFGAGGIIGWSDADIHGCVAMNESVTSKKSGRVGRIAGNMGTIITTVAQGVDCWALEGMPVYSNGTLKKESEMVTGILPASGPYDGETKAKPFLGAYANYAAIGWNFTGAAQAWATEFNSKGYPIHKWLYDRSDREDIDGHQ